MNIVKQQTSYRARINKPAKVIISVLGAAGCVSLILLLPGLAAGLKLALRMKGELKQERIEKELELLIKKGYIDRHKHRSGDTYELSRKGLFLHATHTAFVPERSKPEHTPASWDNIWRVVIFDINEEQRSERDALRKLLHSFGFAYLQQSVWVYPYPCDDFIQATKEQLGLSNNVVYIKAQYIEGDAKMKRYFKLT